MKKMLIALFAATTLMGCSSSKTDATIEQTTNAGASAERTSVELKGSITMAGSTSMEKLSNALSEVFMEKHPGVTLQAEFTGSGAGVEAVVNQTVDIGNASRSLKEEELAKGVVDNVVAIDGIGVIVDAKNTVEDLTKEQLVQIYDGTIRNWSEVGGEDAPIVVVGREAGSGTRNAFEEILRLEDMAQYSNELDSTGAVMAKVASTPGAIGYVSLDVIDETVKAVKLEGVEPTADSIREGNYFLSRPFIMATNGEIADQNELVKALFDFLFSEEGSELVKAVGLIPVN